MDRYWNYVYNRTQYKSHLWLEPFTPQNEKNLKWELCQNQTENYHCGYETVIFTPNFNLKKFYSNPLDIYIFM
jgi:hypothetical protein